VTLGGLIPTLANPTDVLIRVLVGPEVLAVSVQLQQRIVIYQVHIHCPKVLPFRAGRATWPLLPVYAIARSHITSGLWRTSRQLASLAPGLWLSPLFVGCLGSGQECGQSAGLPCPEKF